MLNIFAADSMGLPLSVFRNYFENPRKTEFNVKCPFKLI